MNKDTVDDSGMRGGGCARVNPRVGVVASLIATPDVSSKVRIVTTKFSVKWNLRFTQ